MPGIPSLFKHAGRAASLALLSGCCCGPLDPNEAEREALRAGRARWGAAGVASYRYTLELSAMIIGGRPVAVEVRDGKPVSVRYADTGQPVSATAEGGFVARFDTVEEMFAALAEALEGRQGRVSAAYDGPLGYPVSAEVDPVRNAIDDEYRFRVSGFEALR